MNGLKHGDRSCTMIECNGTGWGLRCLNPMQCNRHVYTMRLRYEICVTLINNGLCLCRFHDGSSGTSDPYCIVKVDNEVVAR